MSFRRPAAGRQVGAGVLRVDAARAIAKLRDFQLANPCAWILEAVRAAAISGATSISVDGDANDIWLSLEGGEWSSDCLPELLSELVSPSVGSEGRKRRLLATAINSALGMKTAYIDVYGFSEQACRKVRYMPSVLESGDKLGDDSSLLALQLEAAELPSKAPDACSLFIHLRRRMGMAVLRNFLNREPPEFALLRKSCEQLPIPLEISGEPLTPLETEILRVPLGNDLDGFIALLDKTDPSWKNGTRMEVAELGVLITEYVVRVSEISPSKPVPLRVYINAERMPTNASRSEVRRDEYPLRDAESLLADRFSALCQSLVTNSTASGERGERVREGILSLLSAHVSGRRWLLDMRILPSPFSQLAALPLLQNPVGVDRRADAVWEKDLVYTGTKPLPGEFEPWVRRVLWARPGMAVEKLTAEGASDRFDLRLRQARSELKAQKRFLAQEKQVAMLRKPPRHWVRSGIANSFSNTCAPPLVSVPDGEVCLVREETDGKFTLLLEGRLLEEIRLESILPFRAIVSSSLLRPESNCASAKRNRGYEKVLEAAFRSAIRCVEAMCLDGAEGFSYLRAASGEELRGLALKAMGLVRQLGLTLSDDSPLSAACIWRLADGRMVSLSALRMHRAIGVSLETECSVGPPGRPVVLADSAWECDVLEDALSSGFPSKPHIVYYGKTNGEFAPRMAGSIASGNLSAWMEVEREGIKGRVGWGKAVAESFLELYHCGRWVEKRSLPQMLSPLHLWLDSDSVIPTSDWTSVVEYGITDTEIQQIEIEFVRAFALALSGKPPANFSHSSASLSSKSFAGGVFIKSLGKGAYFEETLGPNGRADLAKAPIFTRLDGELCSAEELAANWPEGIPFLLPHRTRWELARLRVLEWNPLLAQRAVAEFASTLSGRRCYWAKQELDERVVGLERAANFRRHLAKNPPTSARQEYLAHAKGVVEFNSNSATGLIGIANEKMTLHYFVEERHFQTVTCGGPLAIEAIVNVDHSLADERFVEIPPAVTDMLLEQFAELSSRMLREVLKHNGRAFAGVGVVRRHLLAWLKTSPDKPERLSIFSLLEGRDQKGNLRKLEEFVIDGTLRIAATGESKWLADPNGEVEEVLDRPVLSEPESNLDEVLKLLWALDAGGVVVDCSTAIARLQLDRSVKLGLLIVPTVDVEAPYKRNLSDLDRNECLGEIGFHKGKQSELRLFRNGTLIARQTLKLWPPVWMAIDDSQLHLAVSARERHKTLMKRVSTLSFVLALSVVEAGDLPGWLRGSLAHAILGGQLSPSGALVRAQLFATTSGSHVSWEQLVEQEERFGGVWITNSADIRVPLALDQFALAIDLDDQSFCDALVFWPAEEELALDELTRVNRARPKASSLTLQEPEVENAIEIVELDDLNGLSGVIAPLLPTSKELRCVRVYRRMHPIGTAADPCSWPTLSVVDYSKLLPNRTWSAPADDEAWQTLREHLRRASDQILAAQFPVPGEAVTSYWVGSYVESKISEQYGGEFCVRGRLWLRESAQPGTIFVHSRFGRSEHIAKAKSFSEISLPICGELWIYSAELFAPDDVVQQVARVLYSRLLGNASNSARLTKDQRNAHFALGVLAEVYKVTMSEEVEFSCFDPPVGALDLWGIAGSNKAIVVRDQRDNIANENYVLIDDGTATSRAVLRALSYRIVMPLEIPAKAFIPSSQPMEDRIVFEENTQEHILSALADALTGKLLGLDHTAGNTFLSVSINDERISPIVALEANRIVLAGENTLLLQVIASQFAGQPVDEGLVRLLAAHCIEILAQGQPSFPYRELLGELSTTDTE